jgi:hypothetical protein
MRIRTTVILFVIFAVALVIFAAFQWLGVQTGEEKKHAERFVFPSLNPMATSRPGDVTDPFAKKPQGPQQAKPEDFSSVVIERKRRTNKPERVEFVRMAGEGGAKKWRMIHPLNTRTDDAYVTALVRELIELERQRARDLGRDLANLGLDNADTVVTLTKGDQTYTLTLGDTGAKTKDPVIYALSSEIANRPILLPKSKVEKVFEPIAAYRDKSLVTTSFGTTGLRLAGTSRQAVELTKDKDWTFKEPAIGDADASATEEVIRNLAAIKVERNEDFISDGPLDAAKLEQYGLAENKAPYIYAVTQGPGTGGKPLVEKVIVGKPDDAAAKEAAQTRSAAFAVESLFNPTAAGAAYLVRDKHKVEPMYYYARLAGDDSVIRIPSRVLPPVQKTLDELRSKVLAKVDIAKVDAANLMSGGETLRFRRPDLQGAAEWDLYADNKGKVKTQPQTVQDLLDALAKVEIKDTKAFLDDDAKIRAWFGGETIELGLDKPQAELTVWQEGLARNKEGKVEGTAEPALQEAKKNKPTIKLVIGKKDPKRQVVYVRREAPDLKPVTLAVPDPFVYGDAAIGAQQSFAKPPDNRQTISLSTLMTGGYLAFRERTLPSYRVDQVASVQLVRPSGTYLLEQSETKDDRGMLRTDWKLKQPIEGTPTSSIPEMMLSNLIGTSTDKLIADRATEKELEETYGLGKTPLMKAVVTTRADTPQPAEPNAKETPKARPASTYTYVIGKKLAEGAKYPNHYFARLEAKPGEGPAPESNQFVFAVPANYVNTLDLELRNTTVFPYEATKPAAVTFTWHGETADKKPLTTKLDLALTGEKWEVKSLTENGADAKAKVKFDDKKLNALLRFGPQPSIGGPNVNPFLVDRYLQHGGSIDPKFRLDPAKADAAPRLVLEVKYSDGKTRTVILGEVLKPDPATHPSLTGTYFYAATPALPGVVMLVNETVWKPLVEGYAYFQEAAPKQAQ